MEKFKLIKWLVQGDTYKITNKHYYIPNWTCIFLQGETYINTCVKIIHDK